MCFFFRFQHHADPRHPIDIVYECVICVLLFFKDVKASCYAAAAEFWYKFKSDDKNGFNAHSVWRFPAIRGFGVYRYV